MRDGRFRKITRNSSIPGNPTFRIGTARFASTCSAGGRPTAQRPAEFPRAGSVGGEKRTLPSPTPEANHRNETHAFLVVSHRHFPRERGRGYGVETHRRAARCRPTGAARHRHLSALPSPVPREGTGRRRRRHWQQIRPPAARARICPGRLGGPEASPARTAPRERAHRAERGPGPVGRG